MEVYNEKVCYENPLLSLNIHQGTRQSKEITKWHYHKEVEILSILGGALEVSVDEELYTLTPGDTMIIGSFQLHRDRSVSSEELNYIVLQFDIEHFFDQSMMTYIKYFSETKYPLSRLNYIFRDNPQAKKSLYECTTEIYEEVSRKPEGYEIAVSMLVKKIILILLRNDSMKMLNYKEDADLERLKPVLDYVERHLSDKIQVEEASKLANFSYYYFVKYFKKVLGISFTEYVNYKKIKRAERILLTNNISITQVGEAIGMPNMAHFYKVFKKYNECSPKEYRKKMFEWAE